MQPDSQECFLHGSSLLQNLLPKTLLAGEIRFQGRMAISEPLLPTATHERVSLILSQRESQPVFATPHPTMWSGQGGKRGNYCRHSGQGMPKGTPLVARQRYQNQDWHTREAKADSSRNALLRVSPSCLTS